MKRKRFCLLPRLSRYGVTYADSPFSSLQSAHEKYDFKGLAQMCTPKGALTDEAREKIMASEGTSSIFGRR